MKILTKSILFKIAVLVAIAIIPQHSIIHAANTFSGNIVSKEGAWCWFADPRAVHYENTDKSINVSWIGYIDVHGNIKATQIDFNKKKKTEVLIRSYFQPDDHDSPTFLLLPDKRVMIFYTRHTDEPRFYYRISVNPCDISQLGEEKSINVTSNTTYPSPFILSSDSDHIYICWRGIHWHPTIAKFSLPDLEDNIRIEFGPKQIVQSSGARPYAKYQSNGKDEIYLAYTTGHPDNEYPNWVYFNKIDINASNDDGPILKDLKGDTLSIINNGPFRIKKTADYETKYPLTIVDSPSIYRDWIWQIAIDKSNNPIIAMVRINEAKNSHEYYYARWTGNKWRLTDLANGGGAFHANATSTERCYSGGMSIDPDSINNVYLSIPIENESDKTAYEIWKYTVNDNGTITERVPITRNSKKNNSRPYIIPNSALSPLRLCWMNGDYYYWMVNKEYPKGYPTSIRCDYQLPADNVNKTDALITSINLKGTKITPTSKIKISKVSSKAFTIIIEPNIDPSDYEGVILTIGNKITLGVNRDPRLYIIANGTTYESTSKYYSSDNWARRSTGTSGDWWPTAIKNAKLAITYDGKYLILYRNALIEEKIDIKGLKLGKVMVGGYNGTMNLCEIYNKALNQDEIASDE